MTEVEKKVVCEKIMAGVSPETEQQLKAILQHGSTQLCSEELIKRGEDALQQAAYYDHMQQHVVAGEKLDAAYAALDTMEARLTCAHAGHSRRYSAVLMTIYKEGLRQETRARKLEEYLSS